MTGIQSDLLTYRRTQKAPWWLPLDVLAAVFLTASWFMPVHALKITFVATGLFMLLAGASLHHLTIADEGSQLVIRFGPFPLLHKRIWYDDMMEVERGRTTLLDGWGVHWNPRGGWVWNIWGYDCVVIRLRRRTIRVGTDDPDGLLAFLQARISQRA